MKRFEGEAVQDPKTKKWIAKFWGVDDDDTIIDIGDTGPIYPTKGEAEKGVIDELKKMLDQLS